MMNRFSTDIARKFWRLDTWWEFHVLFGQNTRKRSFYYWLPQYDCFLPDKMTTIADWIKKSSLLRVLCRVQSACPFFIITKPPGKRPVCLLRLCSGKSEPKICIIMVAGILSRFFLKRIQLVTRSNIFQQSPFCQSKKTIETTCF